MNSVVHYNSTAKKYVIFFRVSVNRFSIVTLLLNAWTDFMYTCGLLRIIGILFRLFLFLFSYLLFILFSYLPVYTIGTLVIFKTGA